jgi:hypothetical protein
MLPHRNIRITLYLMLLRKLPVAGVLLLAVVAGCDTTHSYYFQPNHQVPLFKKKNEFAGTATLNRGRYSKGFRFNAAYSLTDHIALGVNQLSHKEKKTEMVNGLKLVDWEGSTIDGSVSYFHDFREAGILEIAGGGGFSRQSHVYTLYEDEFNAGILFPVYSSTVSSIGNADLKHKKVFIQPTYGYSFPMLDVAVSARLAYLFFGEANNNVTSNTNEWRDVDRISGSSCLSIEPCLTVRGGWKFVKMQMQFGIAAQQSISMTYDRTFFNIGVHFTLAERLLHGDEEADPDQ